MIKLDNLPHIKLFSLELDEAPDPANSVLHRLNLAFYSPAVLEIKSDSTLIFLFNEQLERHKLNFNFLAPEHLLRLLYKLNGDLLPAHFRLHAQIAELWVSKWLVDILYSHKADHLTVGQVRFHADIVVEIGKVGDRIKKTVP